MNIRELIPLIRYMKVRTPNTADDKWKELMKHHQEQIILSIAFRHDFNEYPAGWALGCAVIHHYRDFCGGVMVESGRVDLDMSGTHSYTSHQIIGGRESIDAESLPHINELVANPPQTREQLRVLLEKSVAGAVASMALGSSRSMVHFMDKVDGGLTNIMKHLNVETLSDIPHQCLLTSSGGRIQPFIHEERRLERERTTEGRELRHGGRVQPDSIRIPMPSQWTTVGIEMPISEEIGVPTTPAVTNITESMVEFHEVEVSWTESGDHHNQNSGNDVYGAIINLSRQIPPSVEPAHCEGCDETFTYDGFTDCPECGDELFDASLTGRTSHGRSHSVVAAIRDKFTKPGAWRFMPHSIWRCG